MRGGAGANGSRSVAHARRAAGRAGLAVRDPKTFDNFRPVPSAEIPESSDQFVVARIDAAKDSCVADLLMVTQIILMVSQAPCHS